MIYYYYYFLYRNKHIQKERDFNTNVHHKLYQKVMVTFKREYDKLYILPFKENLSARILIKGLNIKYNLNSVIYIYI